MHKLSILKFSATRVINCALLLMIVIGSAQATRVEHVVSTWQPINYDVSITLDDQLSEITRAKAVISVQILKDDLSVIDLDFGELTIDSVKLGDRDAVVDRQPGTLNIQLPANVKIDDRFLISVEYHGKPKDGLVLAKDKDGKLSATGDNWPNRAHHWIPCLDHPSAKATVKFTVTAPARDLVVANGKLDRVTNDSASTRTWTYTEGVPIPAYCMIIAVGEYHKFQPSTPAITPLAYYVQESDASFASTGFSPAPASLKFFSETIAPYPYEKLDLIVGATRFGGMENSSAIVFASTVLGQRANQRTSRAFNINQGLEQVIAHEIAHQWFGDSVTEASWADLWLSEGFATYFAGLFVEKYDGKEAFQEYMKRAADTALAFEKKKLIPIHDTETEDLMDLLNPNNYQKGAWVLHMLRSQLGDRAFFQGVRRYYQENKNSLANSNELRRALERSSGKNLEAFFQRWVFGTGHPKYSLAYDVQPKSNTLVLVLTQSQAVEAFPDPVPVQVTVGSEKKTITILPTRKHEVVRLRIGRGPVNIVVDPDNTILKEVVDPAKLN